jgi:hypothetical protein
MIFVFLCASWNRWELSFKILTPPLHFVFMAAQIHGARILYQLHRKEKKLFVNQERAPSEVEGAVVAERKSFGCENGVNSTGTAITTPANPDCCIQVVDK